MVSKSEHHKSFRYRHDVTRHRFCRSQTPLDGRCNALGSRPGLQHLPSRDGKLPLPASRSSLEGEIIQDRLQLNLGANRSESLDALLHLLQNGVTLEILLVDVKPCTDAAETLKFCHASR